MKIALQVFEQFKKNNEDLFSFDKKATLFGHLRTYIIEKQFYDSAFNPAANYTVFIREVNPRKHKALCIETNDFIINLGRTNSKHELLPTSSYKKEYAKANACLESQLTFDFSCNAPKIVKDKKYAEIIYGYYNGKMTHLKIVLPSSDYQKIEYSIDLLESIKIYENYVPQILVEESIVKLKNSIASEAEKIS